MVNSKNLVEGKKYHYVFDPLKHAITIVYNGFNTGEVYTCSKCNRDLNKYKSYFFSQVDNNGTIKVNYVLGSECLKKAIFEIK
jgi:hypothetical protein